MGEKNRHHCKKNKANRCVLELPLRSGLYLLSINLKNSALVDADNLALSQWSVTLLLKYSPSSLFDYH